jgi:hypothetical protein
MGALHQCCAMERAHVPIGTGITLSVSDRARDFFRGGDATGTSKNAHAVARDTSVLAIVYATERSLKSSRRSNQPVVGQASSTTDII